MLTKTKSVLAGISPTSTDPMPASGSSAPAADASVKAKQLLRGRTRARIETVTTDLEAARLAFARAEQLLGERMVDEGLDVAEVTVEMKGAKDRVRALESALAVAIQKDDAAQAELKRAETEARREVVREKLAQLVAKAQAIDHWMESGKTLFEAYAAQRKSVLDFGDQDINLQIQAANLSFRTYLFRVCGPMANCVTGYEVFQSDPKWAAPWSTHHPQSDEVDRVRVAPPVAKPIKGWQIGD